jgi:hypothetical protein
MPKLTVDYLVSVGAKEIWPPSKFAKQYEDGLERGYPVLVAVLDTAFGEHCKVICGTYDLRAVHRSPYAATWFHLSQKVLKRIKEARQKEAEMDSSRERRRELELWRDLQKEHYHAGILTPEQIAKLEAVPGWTWDRRPGLGEFIEARQAVDEALARGETTITYRGQTITREGDRYVILGQSYPRLEAVLDGIDLHIGCPTHDVPDEDE